MSRRLAERVLGVSGARSVRAEAALLFAFALLLHAASAFGTARSAGVTLSGLGVYYDGHLYLEIARSFPLPYSRYGIAYTGFAPGYPALIAGLRAALPDGWLDWGLLALLGSSVPAALAVVAFHALCRQLGLAAFWPSVLFVVGNWRWMAIAGTPHSEPLAMCLALLCFVAHLRGRLGLAVLCLSLAGLTRFPAFLLGAPLAFDLLIRLRRRDPAALGLLCVPPLAFAAFVAYLHLRIPGYPGLAAAHRVFWDTHFTWPFAALATYTDRIAWAQDFPTFELTYAWTALYLLSIAVGLRPAERSRRFLAVWVAVIVGVHASLSGLIGAWAFQRLVILAWPAALLILWRAFGRRLPAAGAAVLCAVLAALGLGLVVHAADGLASGQETEHPFLPNAIRRLQIDTPHWVYFGEERPQAPAP